MIYEKPNIILIIMDTVRADHLSTFGYHRNTSPNIEKIARKGMVFEKAFSTAEWSPPTHASILTGKYPSFHRTLGKKIDLDKTNITIAEVLKTYGYRTICITANDLISPLNGFGKGFDEHIIVDTPYKSLRFITENYRDFLRTMINGLDNYTVRTKEYIIKRLTQRNIRKKPFFLCVNFLNVHANYDPPYPYKSSFSKGFHQPRFFILEWLLRKITGKSMEKINNEMDLRKLNYLASNEGHFAFITKDLSASEEEWDIIRSWYDGEIRYLDHQIGSLFEFLHNYDFFENTLIIITADHGENLGEHGLASHHFSLYDTIIHVPLILSYPEVIPTGKRLSQIVSTLDIFPTIIDFAGIKVDMDEIQGRSLLPLDDRVIHKYICAECGESIRNYNRPGFAMSLFRDKLERIDLGCKCIRTNKYKYILYANMREELYDLDIDPKEDENLILNNPEIAIQLRKKLEQTIDIKYYGPKEFLTKKENDVILGRLQKLGYIS